MMPRLSLLLVVLAATFADTARADSLTFIKDHNVWLSNADGSGQYQVTVDGTADAPYESPSQADDGTILAIREAPGERPRLYRMTQSGRLLNPPADTPAPGTGALDAKISPDGRRVAYWFVTGVNPTLCPFCITAASRALLGHSDRFTPADEVGTPNTGGWPSWLGNDTIVVGNGSAEQWYYRLGMPEASLWFSSTDFTPHIWTLRDAETAPNGDRIAVLLGDRQEYIAILKMTGPPPAKPVPVNECSLVRGPDGEFTGPTWSSDARLLAFEDGAGIWTFPLPADLATATASNGCAGAGPAVLRVPGASDPDFGPAAVDPGPRPPCGNPGNPTACTESEPDPPQVPQPRAQLFSLLADEAKALRKLGLSGLKRKRQVKVRFAAPGPGKLVVRLTAGRRRTVLARGTVTYRNAGNRTVVLKLTPAGRKRLRTARRLQATLAATFTPAGQAPTRATTKVRLRG